MGDFNAHTRDLQIPLHDRSEDVFCTRGIDPTSVGLHRISEDSSGPTTAYGKHLLQLGESHGLLILNGLPHFQDSQFFTCRPHEGGASVVDYALANPNLLPYIRNLFVSPIPLADHALLSLSLQFDPPQPAHPIPQSPPRTSFRFHEGDPNIFSSFLCRMLPSEAQFSALDSTSAKYQCLSSTIWEAALQSFPHSTRTSSTSPKPGTCPRNKWYDTKCKSLHQELCHAFQHSLPTYPTIRLVYRRLLRRKKRQFIS